MVCEGVGLGAGGDGGGVGVGLLVGVLEDGAGVGCAGEFGEVWPAAGAALAVLCFFPATRLGDALALPDGLVLAPVPVVDVVLVLAVVVAAA
ncbi:MAG TPA: hypothetical protein VF834_01955 [Streptosporangiaceae bacterium]